MAERQELPGGRTAMCSPYLASATSAVQVVKRLEGLYGKKEQLGLDNLISK